ncbi:hypothetical protein N9T25_00910 [Candidatus Pelagibacter sp.]|jgi:hypothetical protein|nr:hypothetical protein [Candidatus Pelagibacter sp.]
MLDKKNLFIVISLIIYFIIGSFLSITNGISHDQYHEQLNWRINFDAIKSLFNNDGGYERLLAYTDKYHGIAFHYFSQPIQLLTNSLVEKINFVNIEYANYISRHLAVFISFNIAGIFFYLLSVKLTDSKNFALTATAVFLLYPYLFGHAQINGKDIPFLTMWLICTYYLFNLVENLYNNKKIIFLNLFLISFFSAFLISIRITGVLILLEYLIALIILINLKNLNPLKFFLKNTLSLLIFFSLLVLFVYILNPIFWHNPLEFFNSVSWMGKFYHDICTLTFGECMSSLNLSPSYFFIWFFFKLPILILLGLLIYPLIEKRLYNNGIKSIYYSTLILSLISILFVFILKDVALYDEIRHIMFLIPFIFLIAFYNIYIFNKKIFYYLSILYLLFFISENIVLKKYQYTWLNSFAKLTNINKNFEVDYMGISNKNIQKKILKYSNEKNINKDICIYGNTYVSAYLEKFSFSCFKNYSELDAAKLRPFFAYQNVRNLKRSDPKDCNLIHEENFKYNFSNQKIVAGKLWYCS